MTFKILQFIKRNEKFTKKKDIVIMPPMISHLIVQSNSLKKCNAVYSQ